MRFNKQELMTVASFPSNKFEKEGILHITEKQDGFFRRTEGGSSDEQRFNIEKLKRRKTINCVGGTSKVNFARWCKLRGNLLFYLKDVDEFSAPSGVIVLENCRPVIRNNKPDIDGYSFFLEFGDGMNQRIAANTDTERTEWFEVIQMASFFQLNKQLVAVQVKIEKKLGISKPQSTIDVNNQSATDEIDIKEFPICESAISCDNLLCDGHGRPPNPFVVVQIQKHGWSSYGRTEVIERCSNPQFLCTICFWSSHGLSSSSIIRFNVYDVREKISRTTIPIGYAEITLGVIQDTTRLRIPLRSVHSNPGFITIASWAPEHDKRSPRSPAKVTVEQQHLGHRRSQSLPPKFGIKLFVPFQGNLPLIFANPSMHTYRLHSGLGGDISVHEFMLESRLCYLIPQQLLSIWILREKELLQEISGMGELGGEWRNKQMDLLDKHLKLLKDYSQAKQNLQQNNKIICNYFKKSSNKADESLEFVPTNLHLQRMWAHNDTLKRSSVVDIITVGAFTRHFGKSKTGGLIKLLQQAKQSPSKVEADGCKVQAANDAVQAIKQLRKEIVEIMSQLLCLAKSKNPMGMLPLCNEMVNKTRTLLNLWEPNLVDETFEFIEQHRILDEPDNSLMPLSPFKKITQQLGALDLKSPELEDFSTPLRAPPDLWPKIKPVANITPTKSFSFSKKSPSTTDINTISTIQNSVLMYNSEVLSRERDVKGTAAISTSTVINTICDEAELEKCDDDGLRFNETHFDVNGDICSNSNSLLDMELNYPSETSFGGGNYARSKSKSKYEEEYIKDNNCINKNTDGKPEILNNIYDLDETSLDPINCSKMFGLNGAFLDTKAMSSSPSANYYRPTEEPEPLDLTQLNIEASVMCLVSKVKFLCGRCGSPAVRLRQPKPSTKRSFNIAASDVVTNQPIKSSPVSKEQSERKYSLQPNTSPSVENVLSLNNNEMPSFSIPKNSNINGTDLNLALTQAVGEVTRRVKKGNKFTDGLDLSLTTDWTSELRPSMRKLRQAMDGLLKTARLMHSVQRLQQDMREISTNLAVMYRRDVCFSQALTALISGMMAKLWGTAINENYLLILANLGALAYFEGLLSLYGNEIDMWGDMCVAVEDLSAVNFTLIRSNIQRESKTVPVPRVAGSRHLLNVLIPVPESVYGLMPAKEAISFKITPVFFNIGINERATISETLGYAREQHRSNWDNFDRLKQYFIRFKKLSFVNENSYKSEHTMCTQTISDYLNALEEQLRTNVSKNVKILHLTEDICRLMQGLRFTSCKSAKDRTGMAVTLEQCRILQQEFHLPTNSVQNVLNTLRSEGTRIDNVVKNIGSRKFAFNLPQVLSLPSVYRPPAGSYGKAQT